jgi:glycerol-3-phosphate acyltransferase PlsY
LFIVPIAALIWFGIGYASLATLSAALVAAVIFAIRAAAGSSPWAYVVYGLAAEVVLMWALRPNIRRLLNGTERMVGWRARRAKTK